MKYRNRMIRLAAAVCTVLLLAGCAETRTVMGLSADGAGRETNRFSHTDSREPSGITICVDAGHGFDDAGTESDYLGDFTEKDITLTIALALKETLEEEGFQVILTHDGEHFPKTREDDGNNLFNPQERIAYADTLDLDYFVSLHCDSYEADSSVRGTRIYYSNGTAYTKASAEAAQKICDAVNAAFPQDKETLTRDMAKDNAYYVIRECSVPSSLIEIGFVTNRSDAANMLDSGWCDSMAEAIAEGISAYFAE